jgi:transcriptional regulator with XRE-family HTH domain
MINTSLTTTLIESKKPENVFVAKHSSMPQNNASEVAEYAWEIWTWLKIPEEWNSREYRQSYMEAAIDNEISWQIRLNREYRGLSQKDLAKKTGTKQSAISRIENQEYAKHSMSTLTKIAHAFDCAIQIRFISYKDLALRVRNVKPENLIVYSFNNESRMLKDGRK